MSLVDRPLEKYIDIFVNILFNKAFERLII